MSQRRDSDLYGNTYSHGGVHNVNSPNSTITTSYKDDRSEPRIWDRHQRNEVVNNLVEIPEQEQVHGRLLNFDGLDPYLLSMNHKARTTQKAFEAEGNYTQRRESQSYGHPGTMANDHLQRDKAMDKFIGRLRGALLGEMKIISVLRYTAPEKDGTYSKDVADQVNSFILEQQAAYRAYEKQPGSEDRDRGKGKQPQSHLKSSAEDPGTCCPPDAYGGPDTDSPNEDEIMAQVRRLLKENGYFERGAGSDHPQAREIRSKSQPEFSTQGTSRRPILAHTTRSDGHDVDQGLQSRDSRLMNEKEMMEQLLWLIGGRARNEEVEANANEGRGFEIDMQSQPPPAYPAPEAQASGTTPQQPALGSRNKSKNPFLKVSNDSAQGEAPHKTAGNA
ncbi:hypothetical protein FPV67DRAFT_1664013 [Lyophyllum atratum]|nr:hypothetical protein FPV67DRAFT_1664013 [Lyophyllum atratum]